MKQEEKKPREFWIDLSDEHDGDLPLAFKEHPRQGPLRWQSDLIHVIEYSAYEQLKAKLEKANEGFNAIISAYKSGCVEYKGCECWWQNAIQYLKEIEGDL